MARVIMLPGLAVHRYLEPAAEALRATGHDVTLCPPLGWRSTGTDLTRYGGRIASQLRTTGHVDLIIGMSVGTQIAVAAALAGAPVEHLLLISPTIDPERRSLPAALTTWLGGENHRDSPGATVHFRDWLRAGPSGIYRSLYSAINFRLEDELPQVDCRTTIVHGDADQLSPLPFAAGLAQRARVGLLIMPDAPHSWPVADGDRFVDLVDEIT